jgi:hypothetical protein
MESEALIYLPSFMKIGSSFQKLRVGIHTRTHTNKHTHTNTHTHTHTHTNTQQGGLIRLLLFFQNQESRLKQ